MFLKGAGVSIPKRLKIPLKYAFITFDKAFQILILTKLYRIMEE